jgi:hypothetical protein
MSRRSIYLWASILFLAAAGPLHAQAPDDVTPVTVDPPDTVYQRGLEDIDPGIAATLPIAPEHRAYIPVSTDLSFRLPRPGNQGKAGSCTAWAVAYAARGYYTSTLENRDVHQRRNIVSPNYVYTLAKQISNKPACQGGSSIYSAVEVLKKGALSLLEYPYHDSDCDAAPSPQVTETAHDFRVRGFRLVDYKKLDDVKGNLAQSNPVIIEFHDSPTWQHHRGSGVFNDGAFDATQDSWHAMTLVGYDERKQAFRLVNSWGTGWGDGGYAWLGYDAFSARVRRAAVLDVAPPAPIETVKVDRPEPVKPKVAEVIVQPRPVDPPKPVIQPKPMELPNPVVQPKPVEQPKPVVQPKPEDQPKPVVQPKPIELPKPVVEVNPRPTPGPIQPVPNRKPEIADLATLTCGKIDVRKNRNRNILAGFVGSDADLDLVRRVAAAVPNTSLGDVTLAPWPQCEALQTLEKPLAAIGQPKINLGPDRQRRAGEVLKIAIQSPAQISYLYVSYVQADGSVVHLVQPEGVVAQPTLPNKTMTFGDGKDGQATFTVSEPFGREMVIAIASRSPLFETALPARQTEREYLTALRQALVYKSSPDMPDRELSASIKTLQTEPRVP